MVSPHPRVRQNDARVCKHDGVREDLSRCARQMSATGVLRQVDRLSPNFRLVRDPGAIQTEHLADVGVVIEGGISENR